MSGRRWAAERRLGWEVSFVAMFLATAHIAMIFGMLNPHLLMPGGSSDMVMAEGRVDEPCGLDGVVVAVAVVAAVAAFVLRRGKADRARRNG